MNRSSFAFVVRFGVAITIGATDLAAQQSRPDSLRAAAHAAARADSARADSARAQSLAAVTIDVARSGAAGDRVPWAVARQGLKALRRGQATVGVDEALANMPGVVVANRYNYALDQRISIRGAGSRANFGLRGVKVLLDGIPQSLPDGQSQLTNVDLGAMGSVEVLRGSASSLYGNGSGGVISFTSDLTAPHRLGATLRSMGGSFGLAKTQLRTSGRTGNTIGALSLSRTTVDGFRQYSAADTRQYLMAVDHALTPSRTLAFRLGSAEVPEAKNPGAITAAEYAVNPDTAALNNVRRGASREVSQRYTSLRLREVGARGEWSASVYGQRRFVDNALAVAPPAPAGPTNGTFSTLDRRVLGLRVDASRTLERRWSPRLAGGLDVQRSHDVRRNQRATAGRPTAPVDTLLLDQNEIVLSVGPFAQLRFDPRSNVTVSVGGRFDRLAFRVEDAFLGDGDDDSGDRPMTAASGHVGVVWRQSAPFAPYANIATSFETPTTTELQVRPDGQGGFNPDLGPQRIRTMEIGARGQWTRDGSGLLSRVDYEVAVFQSDADDAIVQFLETAGRAFFRNAGRTRSRGAEIGVNAQLTSWLALQSAYTLSVFRFVDYRVPSATNPAPALDTLDGNRLAGVPERAYRVGLRAFARGVSVDVDHSVQSALWGDDANTVRVEGWGRGQLNVRAAWTGRWRGWHLEPFASVQNLLDERYIGAVTLNGFGGRVLEPAPGRNYFVGLELGVPVVR